MEQSDKIEPWFKEYYENKVDSWENFTNLVKSIRKFKTENQLSQRTYIDLTIPLVDLLRLNGFLLDLIGSQGIVNINTGEFKIEVSKWQNQG